MPVNTVHEWVQSKKCIKAPSGAERFSIDKLAKSDKNSPWLAYGVEQNNAPDSGSFMSFKLIVVRLIEIEAD